jgi:hypothetical protein
MTDDEIMKIWHASGDYFSVSARVIRHSRALIAAHEAKRVAEDVELLRRPYAKPDGKR